MLALASLCETCHENGNCHMHLRMATMAAKGCLRRGVGPIMRAFSLELQHGLSGGVTVASFSRYMSRSQRHTDALHGHHALRMRGAVCTVSFARLVGALVGRSSRCQYDSTPSCRTGEEGHHLQSLWQAGRCMRFLELERLGSHTAESRAFCVSATTERVPSGRCVRAFGFALFASRWWQAQTVLG